MIKSFYLFIPLFAALTFTRCKSDPESTKFNASFPVIQPMLVDTAYSNDYVAEINSRQNVEIRARIRGYLDGIFADEGEHVKAGQKLFSIGSQRYKEELAKAKAALKGAVAEAKNAELRVTNVQTLVDKKVVSKSELEMEQSKLEAANASVDAAKANEATAALNLSLTEIKAPFDGILNRIPYKIGSLINEETLLTSISDNKEVFVYFHVSEREYLKVIAKKTTGKTEVSLLLADNQLYKHKGVIETVEGEFDKTTGNIAFRARFPNPEEILKNGSTGQIRLRNELKKALVIPQKSTFEIQDKIYVYVVDKTNKIQMRPIVTKQRLDYLYVVASGLSPLDKVLYEGIQQVKEGDVIIPQPAQMKKLLALELKK